MSFPKRIISLVPSQTELLFDLGLEKELVGITRFCIHPKKIYQSTAKVGGTKNFRFDIIERLEPDLILANKEENYQEGIEKLAQKHRVWVSDIVTLSDAYEMIAHIGSLVGKTSEAQALIVDIQTGFDTLKCFIKQQKPKPKNVLYFIWRKPYMVAAKHTFIDAIIQQAGFQNTANQWQRYPELSEQELSKLNPDEIWLSSEPYRFSAKHYAEFATLFPHAQIKIVNGEFFSWYGSRLLQVPDYIIKFLYN